MSGGPLHRTVHTHPEASGLAVIFTNDYANTTLQTLSGTAKDGEKMRLSLTKLNFATHCEQNASLEVTIKLIGEVASYAKYPASYRRIVVVFSGHGTVDQKLYAGDGATIAIHDIISSFNPERAPLLGNIPKIFLIDACRGNQTDHGVLVPRGGTVMQCLKVPSKGNFLVAYSTLPDHMSFEDGEGGMWMSILAKKILADKSLVDILTDVNKELLPRFEESDRIQQPEFISRLNESIYFFRESQCDKENTCDEGKEISMDYHHDSLTTGVSNNKPTKTAAREAAAREAAAEDVCKTNTSPQQLQHGRGAAAVAATADQKKPNRTAKSKLKEYFETKSNGKKMSIKYETKEEGHEFFRSTVFCPIIGRATGEKCSNKKDAEHSAAKKALQKLEQP